MASTRSKRPRGHTQHADEREWKKPCIVITRCAKRFAVHMNMVDIAQLVEHLIVVQKVARSSRVIHPTKALPMRKGFFISN